MSNWSPTRESSRLGAPLVGGRVSIRLPGSSLPSKAPAPNSFLTIPAFRWGRERISRKDGKPTIGSPSRSTSRKGKRRNLLFKVGVTQVFRLGGFRPLACLVDSLDGRARVVARNLRRVAPADFLAIRGQPLAQAGFAGGQSFGSEETGHKALVFLPSQDHVADEPASYTRGQIRRGHRSMNQANAASQLRGNLGH